MIIKIISIISPTVSLGHYKRSILLKRILNKKNKVELMLLKKKKLKDLKKIYDVKIKQRKFDYLVFDISNKLILNKKLIKFIELLIIRYKNKVVITDSLGKDAISPYLKNQKFILHLPYILSRKDVKNLKKKFKLNMLGLKYSLISDKVKTNSKSNNNSYILISFGASDKYSKSYEVLKAISNNSMSKILFVVGPFFKNEAIKKIKNFVKLNKNIKLVNFKKTLSFYFKSSKIIITNAGISKYEGINTNKPVMVVYENKNIYKLNKNFIRENLSYNFLYKKENINRECSAFLEQKFNFTSHLKNREKISYRKNENFENFLKKL